VPSASEDNPAFIDLNQTMGEAATAIKNRESGNVPEGCEVSGELEIAYTLYALIGQTEPWIVTTTVPFALDLKEITPEFSTEAKVSGDLDFAQEAATIRNHVDYDVAVDVYFIGGAKPLSVELTINGGSSVTIATPGVNMGAEVTMWHSPDMVEEGVSLTFPLTDGAVQEVGLEGWKDWKEWKVTLRLAPR